MKLETQKLVEKAKQETREAYKEKNELQNVMEEYTKTIEKMIGKRIITTTHTTITETRQSHNVKRTMEPCSGL
jgi:hypothetical protein